MALDVTVAFEGNIVEEWFDKFFPKIVSCLTLKDFIIFAKFLYSNVFTGE